MCALSAIADPAADAVMLKKRPAEPPTRSFLEDVLPVKEVKASKKSAPVADEAKAPAPAPKAEPAKPAETPAPKAEPAKPVEPPVPKAETVKPAEPPAPKVEPAKPAEPPAPKAEPVKPVESPAPKVEPVKPVEAKAEAPAAKAEPAEAKTEAKAETAAAKGKGEKSEAKAKAKPPARDAIITADRTDYDRKEGVVLFDRNVYVDDAQYQMHADRLFLFLDGTNDLKRLVAIGHVAITNEDKRAYCARATFNKKLGRVVMYSSDEITAQLHEEGKKGSDVKGEKITFWLDSEQVEVENPVITMPGGIGGKDSMKKMLGK